MAQISLCWHTCWMEASILSYWLEVLVLSYWLEVLILNQILVLILNPK